MELKEYFRLAWRWAWLLVLGMILALVSAYIFTSYQSPVYQATSRVQVMSAPQSGGSDYSFWNDQQLARTFVQTIKSRLIIEEVEARLGVNVDSISIRTQVVADTQLIDIFVEDDNPQRAADIANMIFIVFAEQNESLQSSRYNSSETSLKAQITQVEGQINSLQGEIDELATQSVQTQTSQVEAEITRLKTEIAQIEADIQRTGTGVSSLPNTEKEAQLSQLKSMLSLYQEIYTNLVVAGKPSEAGTVDRLSRLQKTLDLYQQIYLQLLSSLEDIRLARLQNSSNIVQIESAQAPSSPIRPRLLVNLGLSAVLGLMLAAGVVFVIEYMNDTLESSVDVNTMLGLPIIGYIAEMNKAPEPGEIHVSSNPRSPVAEAFRSLRANLEFADKEQPIKTILVTSSRPDEGKTTIATNLAAIFAQTGKKVILVDADLRRPNVHGMTGVQNRMGLSTLFKAQLSIDKVWRKRPGSDNLYIITSGSPLENPAELLSSERMMLIMAELRKAADIVVVDSPPSVVADAQILSSLVDGVILVVQPGKSPINEAQATLTQMKTAGARMLGVVFNRIPRNRSHYYGGYRYYNHQGYHDYAQDDPKSRLVNPTSEEPLGNDVLPAPAEERSNGRSKPIVEPMKKK